MPITLFIRSINISIVVFAFKNKNTLIRNSNQINFCKRIRASSQINIADETHIRTGRFQYRIHKIFATPPNAGTIQNFMLLVEFTLRRSWRLSAQRLRKPIFMGESNFTLRACFSFTKSQPYPLSSCGIFSKFILLRRGRLTMQRFSRNIVRRIQIYTLRRFSRFILLEFSSVVSFR